MNFFLDVLFQSMIETLVQFLVSVFSIFLPPVPPVG